MWVVLVISFVVCITTIADGYIVRPFPKGEPTGRDQEMMVKLRMPGAKPNLVIFSTCMMNSILWSVLIIIKMYAFIAKNVDISRSIF